MLCQSLDMSSEKLLFAFICGLELAKILTRLILIEIQWGNSKLHHQITQR